MVMEYCERFYLPSARRTRRLTDESLARAKVLSDWKQAIFREWNRVSVYNVQVAAADQLRVGQALDVSAEVHLGGLSPRDVSVQLYTGGLDNIGRLMASESIPMHPDGDGHDGRFRYAGQIPCQASGRRGFAIRVLPAHEDLANPHELALIRWAE